MAVSTWLAPVNAASTGNIPNWTSAGGGTITSPPGTLDGVTINASNPRVLLKDQTTPSQNGVYAYSSTGPTWVFTGSGTDLLQSGTAVRVETGGTINAATHWALRDQTSSYQWVKQILRVTLPRVQQVLDHTRESAIAHSS
jgi:hypothetical protein